MSGLAELRNDLRNEVRYGLRYLVRDSAVGDRKSTRLNSSHSQISYAVFCLKKKKLVPSLTEDQFSTIHRFIRKSAHVTEYFVFCLLLYRGVRGDCKWWRWTWSLSALFCTSGYSVLDEIHQAFVASRTASGYDSLLDSMGALAAFGALRMWFRWRRSSREAEIEASKAPST